MNETTKRGAMMDSLFLEYLLENFDIIFHTIVVVIIPFIFIIIKTTSWGKANSNIIEEMLKIIKKLDAEDVKKEIINLQKKVSDKEHDVLIDKIKTVEDDMETPGVKHILKREISRSFGLHKKESDVFQDEKIQK